VASAPVVHYFLQCLPSVLLVRQLSLPLLVCFPPIAYQSCSLPFAESSTKKRKLPELESGTRKKAKNIPDEGSSNDTTVRTGEHQMEASAPSNQPGPALPLGTDARVLVKKLVPTPATRSSNRTGKTQRKDLVLDAQPIGHSTPPRTFQPLFDDIPPSEPMLPSPSTLVPTTAREKASAVKRSKGHSGSDTLESALTSFCSPQKGQASRCCHRG
jgi:hypothetical protein